MKKTWKQIPDTEVRHLWQCSDPCCTESTEEVYISPDFYEDCGTPVCRECDEDLTYLQTEVLKGA